MPAKTNTVNTSGKIISSTSITQYSHVQHIVLTYTAYLNTNNAGKVGYTYGRINPPYAPLHTIQKN